MIIDSLKHKNNTHIPTKFSVRAASVFHVLQPIAITEPVEFLFLSQHSQLELKTQAVGTLKELSTCRVLLIESARSLQSRIEVKR